MENLKAIFLAEASDLLADLEKSLLSLEKEPNNSAIIEQAFRVMHTFKGNSNMFGFVRIGDFTHHLETVYDLIRCGKLHLSRQIISVTFTCIDHLRKLVDDENLANEQLFQQHKELQEQIEKFISPASESTAIEINVPVEQQKTETFYISFSPRAHYLRTGGNPFYVIEDLGSLGECITVPSFVSLPDFESIDIYSTYITWNILLSTHSGKAGIEEVFIFCESDCDITISSPLNFTVTKDALFQSTVIQYLQDNQQVSTSGLEALVHKISGKVKEDDAILLQQDNKQQKEFVSGSSIRVASDKLDDLMNLVSELVTTQARLSLHAENHTNADLLSIAENIEKISRRLRDNTFSICLVPIDTMMVRFRRLVRDIASELGKEVQFITEGAETELDKTIIDQLTDPLMHILRNSLDHGIENPQDREKKGKPKQGKIVLKSYYSGTNVHIVIEDDGKGIDVKRVRAKAIEKALISPDAALSDREIFDLIFLPGFSTAASVTELSGRGVGMDVVKKNITAIRGEIDIKSTVDHGTTITIKLPLTLSIIDGLLVQIDHSHYVIPLTVIDKCYEVRKQQIKDQFNNLIVLDGKQIPFYYLREEFKLSEEAPEVLQMVVVKYEDVTVGLVVDMVVGEYQAVLKPLGRLYRNLDIISGATILGDGSIALVLDSNQIIRQFSSVNKVTEGTLI